MTALPAPGPAVTGEPVWLTEVRNLAKRADCACGATIGGECDCTPQIHLRRLARARCQQLIPPSWFTAALRYVIDRNGGVFTNMTPPAGAV
jgi:hypothetical protein